MVQRFTRKIRLILKKKVQKATGKLGFGSNSLK